MAFDSTQRNEEITIMKNLKGVTFFSILMLLDYGKLDK